MKKSITLKEIEKAGAEFKTNVAICKHFGVSANYISQRSANDPEFKKALERGRNGGKSLDTPEPTLKSVDPEPTLKSVDFDISETEAREKILAAIDSHYCSKQAIRRRAGLEEYTEFEAVLSDLLSDKIISIRNEKLQDIYVRPEWQIKKYWTKGKGQTGFVMYGDELEESASFKTHSKNGNAQFTDVLPNKGEKDKAEKLVSAEQSPEPLQKPASKLKKPKDNLQITDILISENCRLVVGMDGNIFDMSAVDREKLNKIIDILQAL